MLIGSHGARPFSLQFSEVHFGIIKFEEQMNAVKVGAPFYWWKRVLPPLEFGSMHAILFQMSLLPLTMCRYSIAEMTTSSLERYIPLNRILRMHIHLGYVMIGIVTLATTVFLIFFGVLCHGGQQDFCDKITSEIMCTGYGILAALLIVGGTSYFRHHIPYEIFYAIHHLVFIMYAITVAHTFDNVQRNDERERSQTFKWFTASILYYVCDRAIMKMNHQYRARLINAAPVVSSDGCKMIVLRIERPALFTFRPGQFAFLRLRDVDIHWHPFSITSGPDSDCLEFYIEVFDKQSWSSKVWDLMREHNTDPFVNSRTIEFDMMGPCGTALAKTEDFSHALAIGTGTGIVPILSLLNMHVSKVLKLSPEVYFRELKQRQAVMKDVVSALEPRRRTLLQAIASIFDGTRKTYERMERKSKAEQLRDTLRTSISTKTGMIVESMSKTDTRVLRKRAFDATRSIYGVAVLTLFPVIGLTVLGVSISWNTIPVESHEWMVKSMKVSTVFFQTIFAIVATSIWKGGHIFTLIDAVMILIAPFADLFWFHEWDIDGELRASYLTLYCIMIGYMSFRCWDMAVRPRHVSWRCGAANDSSALERLEIVWSTRSCSLVAEILPGIEETWRTLVKTWGRENASAICRISVYVTDKDPSACAWLQKKLGDMDIYTSGCVHFHRPDFHRVIEDHTIDMVNTRQNSYSLLAFCGSRELAREIHSVKISNDIVASITGNKKHQMEFVSESSGGVKKRKDIVDTEFHASDLSDHEDEAGVEVHIRRGKGMTSQSVAAVVQADSDETC